MSTPDSASLSKLIRDSGVAFRENATSYVFTCPRCDKKDKLAIYKEGSCSFICYHCQGNGYKGRPEFALTELLGMPLAEIRKKIYGEEIAFGLIDLQLVDYWGDSEEEDFFVPEIETRIPEIAWSPDVIGVEDPRAFLPGARYLHSRGLTIEHVRTYDLRYSTVDRRVVFPVKVDNKLVGWQGRYIGATTVWLEDEQRVRKIPKVLTSKSLQGEGKRFLMFQDRLKGSEHCVLTEGPITALKAHKCGGNVATMGKDIAMGQLETLRKSGVSKLYIALDPDAGTEIARLAYDLYDSLEIYLLQPPQNFLDLDAPENDSDLGDLTEDVVYDLFKRAKPEPRGRLYISLGALLAC